MQAIKYRIVKPSNYVQFQLMKMRPLQVLKREGQVSEVGRGVSFLNEVVVVAGRDFVDVAVVDSVDDLSASSSDRVQSKTWSNVYPFSVRISINKLR